MSRLPARPLARRADPSSRRRRLAPVLVGLAVVAIVVGLPTVASAHATLVASSPGDGAQLDEAPDRVTLEFSEPVTASLGAVRVIDANGERVDDEAVEVTDLTVAVGLRDGLGDGTYVVTYRVTSADSHPIRGGLVFSVGDAAVDGALVGQFLDEDDDRPWEVAGAALRWLTYAAVLLAAGGALFLAVVHDGGAERVRLRRLVLVAAAVGLAGALLQLPVQAALATGQGFTALTNEGVLEQVLGEGVGVSLLLLFVGLGAVALGLQAWRSHLLALAGAVLASVSFALAGHTRSTDVEVLAVVSAAVHAVAAAAWFGGLVLLILVLRARRRDPDSEAGTLGALVSRFSVLGSLAIAALTIAGLVLTWSEVRAARALTSTTYGWLLVAKVGVAAVIGFAAFYNHFRLVPALRRDPPAAAWQRLGRTVRFEVVGLVAIVALTAVLSNVTPARTAAGVGQVFSDVIDLGDDGTVQVVVDPNLAGTNTIHLYFYDESGRPTEISDDVTVELTKGADEIGPIARTPQRAGDGHFQLVGDELVSGGRWTITVLVRISRFEQASGQVDVLVG